ncbi:hypothetical protein [Nocardioides caricicola]|uniref:Uncharacterized protein n=1 Tax=Nocardioides caricicola TaxID=634770 RepID=A0ABW0N6T9_9ACTN
MRCESLLGQSAGTGDYWYRFEARLRALPATEDDAEARADLIATAHALRSSDGDAADPEAFADLAYRLRHQFGSTVSSETLADVRNSLEIERDRLLGQGVSPELLGLS